jgi:hypothetical protein
VKDVKDVKEENEKKPIENKQDTVRVGKGIGHDEILYYPLQTEGRREEYCWREHVT